VIAAAIEFFAIAVLTVLTLAVLLLDLGWGASAHEHFVATAWVIAAIVAVPAWLIRKKRAVAWIFVAVSALLMILPYVPHTLVKSYGQFYAGVKPGMTRADVLARLDDYYPDRSKTRIPTVRGNNAGILSLSLGDDYMPYNAEWIVIRFTGGVVSSTSYSPD
jgi:hypothetical protein